MLEMGKMSKKRKISIILALVLTMIFVSGCAKCIDTQYSTVEVKVVDKVTRAEGGRARTETLWMNYEMEDGQLSLSI